MPRRPRIHLDGVPLHIVQRGHNHEPCFFAEDDYSSYLHWLGEALTEAEWRPRGQTTNVVRGSGLVVRGSWLKIGDWPTAPALMQGTGTVCRLPPPSALRYHEAIGITGNCHDHARNQTLIA